MTTRIDSHSLAHVLAQLGGLGGVTWSIPSKFDLDEDTGVEETTERSRIRKSNKIAKWYMAPEVIRGERETKASDIFSFGMMAYSSITMTYDRASMNGFFHPSNDEAWELEGMKGAPHEAAVAFHKLRARQLEQDDDAFRVSYSGKTGTVAALESERGQKLPRRNKNKDTGENSEPSIANIRRRRGRRRVSFVPSQAVCEDLPDAMRWH